MARTKAMAEIEAAMTYTEVTTDPPPVPGLTPEKAEKKANERLAQEEKDRETSLQQQLSQREEAEDKISEQAQNAMAMISDFWKSTQNALGNIPTYGSLLFPLSILLVFFFLLLPVNGHTRAVWLWLVITGQASIAPVGGVSSGDFGTPTPVTPTNTAFTVPNVSGNFLEIPRIRGINPLGGTFAEDF